MSQYGGGYPYQRPPPNQQFPQYPGAPPSVAGSVHGVQDPRYRLSGVSMPPPPQGYNPYANHHHHHHPAHHAPHAPPAPASVISSFQPPHPHHLSFGSHPGMIPPYPHQFAPYQPPPPPPSTHGLLEPQLTRPPSIRPPPNPNALDSQLPLDAGPRFVTPSVAKWIDSTPLPTALAFQDADSSDEEGSHSGDPDASKKRNDVGPIAPGRSADRQKGIEIPLAGPPKSNTNKKKKKSKSSKRHSKRYSHSSGTESDNSTDADVAPLPSDWVKPVGNGVMYYNPAKPTTKYYNGTEGAKKVVKKAGALSQKELKKLQKRAAETGEGDVENDGLEANAEDEGEESDERENMNEWVKKKALELAAKGHRTSVRKSVAFNGSHQPGDDDDDDDDDHKPILLSGSNVPVLEQQDDIVVKAPPIKLDHNSLRKELFVQPGRSRVSVIATKEKQDAASDGSTDSGTDSESDDGLLNDEKDDKEADDELLATAAARLSKLNMGDLLPDSLPIPTTNDDAFFVPESNDTLSIADTATLTRSKTIKGPNGQLIDTMEVLAQLQELQHTASNADQDPASAMEACKFIIENVQYLHEEPDLEKKLCELVIRTLKKLSSLGQNLPPHLNITSADAMQLLANLYVSGIPGLSSQHRPDYARAFPLYLSAAKKEHPDGAFHVGLCYEKGAGVAASFSRAVQYYKKAALWNHPGAMFRLGTALLTGDLNLRKNNRDAVKWLRLSTKYADERYPHALYELALLYDIGIKNVIWTDHAYTLQLLTRGAELGHSISQYALGEAYQFGRYSCPIDPARSIYYYTLAAENGHPEAMFDLGGWYLTGASDPETGFELMASDYEARKWVEKAADAGLPRAMYAMGTFLEMGIGKKRSAVVEDPEDALVEAIRMYKKAADAGDEKALVKLKERGVAYQPSKSTENQYVGPQNTIFLNPGAGLDKSKEGEVGASKVKDGLNRYTEKAIGAIGGGVTGRITGRRTQWDEELDGGNKCVVM
ncbi:hypothetical protein HDV05_004184 [Chytridiales sp. JEL 0842]|nr:hypothetical protein HDV05_004184 [Chytridiales sp. JEL 0842]